MNGGKCFYRFKLSLNLICHWVLFNAWDETEEPPTLYPVFGNKFSSRTTLQYMWEITCVRPKKKRKDRKKRWSFLCNSGYNGSKASQTPHMKQHRGAIHRDREAGKVLAVYLVLGLGRWGELLGNDTHPHVHIGKYTHRTYTYNVL